ncbi:MAG: translation elongation factor Ts [Polyangiaceae bacterium]
MAVNAQAIKELRERTSAGMSDCKSALEEASGDMEKAVLVILKKGLAKSAKKAGAVAAEGEVRASVSKDKRAATLVEVNIQTDFSARNDVFKQFVGDVLGVAENAKLGSELGKAPLAGSTVNDMALALTGKIGEKIAVRRWDRVSVPEGKHGLAFAYVHMGGKIGVVLTVETEGSAAAAHAEVEKLAENTALQIASMSPLVLERSEVTKEMTDKQRGIYEGQMREDPKPKPEAAWPKIIEGKLNKWYSEIALLDQESVCVPGQTIEKLREAASKAAGAPVTIGKFVRYQLGEGIDRGAPKDDFAAEVAKMAGG